ncbi:MAG: RagB/SusD family nutrient uptake outer membrane protein [Bacteroidales bacterium]|nr:RagB/SusD family nutrient uptake outer membrane protein [Bacteroidales bacterium]
MKTTHIILSIFASVALLASCSEKLLDIPQQGVQSEANSYITDEDCEAATAAVYAAWRHAWSGTGSSSASGTTYCNLFWFKNLLSDEFHAGSHTNQTDLGNYTYTNSNLWIGAIYEFLYKTVYYSNIVIDKFKPESETKTRCIAEAKFFRALAYYELITLWGRVPLVDHVMTPENNYQIAPSEIDALWAFVLKDLDEAIGPEDAPVLVSKKSLDDKDTGTRITLEAAYAVRGKVHLTMKHFGQAQSDFGKVITSGKYGLIDNIGDLYHTAANGCKEYIFENVRHWDSNNFYINGADAAQDGWYGLEDNWLFVYGMEAADDAPYPFVTIMGWGAMIPTKKVYDAFVAEEGPTSARRMASVVSLADLPSLKVTITKSLQWDYNEGYFRFKWLMSTEDEVDMAWTGRLNNTPCMRYADVLLMMAEACVRDNKNGDVYINEVRTRAGLGTLTNATMADIKKERLLEMCFEATRLQDLKRWDEYEGDLAANLTDKGKKIPRLLGQADGSATVTWTDNPDPNAGWSEAERYLPYPLVEVQTNKLIDE